MPLAMIAESFIFVLGVLFAIALAQSPGMKWLPWVLVGLGGLFVVLSAAILFIPAPKLLPAFAAGAVLISAVGSRWRWVGGVGGVMGCGAAIAAMGWWISRDGLLQMSVPLARHASHAAGSMGFTMDATRSFAMTTVLALEAVVISVITTRRRKQ